MTENSEQPSAEEARSEREKAQHRSRQMKLMASVSLRAGCVTVVIAGLALAAGLWLDVRMETLPKWTLILVLGSAPLALGLIFFLVNKAVRSSKKESAQLEEDQDMQSF